MNTNLSAVTRLPADALLYSKNYFPTSCASSTYHHFAYGEKYSPESICVLTKASASGTGNSGKPYTPVCVKAICTTKYLYLVLDEDNFERFMDVFEGQTIKVPTKKQYSAFVKSVLVYAYMQKGYTQKEALKKANVKGDRTVYNNLQLLEREMYKMRIPHDKLK